MQPKQAKKCIGKKGCETEDKTCYQTPQRSGYMDNGCEILRLKIQLHMSSFLWCVLIVLFSHNYRSSGTFTQRSLRIVISCAIWLRLHILQYDSQRIFIFPIFLEFLWHLPHFCSNCNNGRHLGIHVPPNPLYFVTIVGLILMCFCFSPLGNQSTI